jgi:hypothetical protein
VAGVNSRGRVIDKDFLVAGQADADRAPYCGVPMRSVAAAGARRFVAGVPAAASPATGVPAPEVATSSNAAHLTLIRFATRRSEDDGRR